MTRRKWRGDKKMLATKLRINCRSMVGSRGRSYGCHTPVARARFPFQVPSQNNAKLQLAFQACAMMLVHSSRYLIAAGQPYTMRDAVSRGLLHISHWPWHKNIQTTDRILIAMYGV